MLRSKELSPGDMITTSQKMTSYTSIGIVIGRSDEHLHVLWQFSTTWSKNNIDFKEYLTYPEQVLSFVKL